MYNNYNNSPNLIISIGSVVSSQQKHSSIKLPNFSKTCSCSLVNSQTNVDDVSMYLKFGHKSITLIMSVPNDGYFRNASCAPNSISTFLLQSLGWYLCLVDY